MIYAVTGHQPHLLGGFGDEAQEALTAFARGWVDRTRPSKIISGMAPGWDLAMARASIRCGVRLVAALAFPEQGQDWPEPAREELDRLLSWAEHVHCHSNERHKGCWTLRDRWVLEQAEGVVALWSGADGGTGRAVAAANAMGLPVVNLWDEWVSAGQDSGRTAA